MSNESNIFDRLVAVEARYEELNGLLSDPDVITDTERFKKLSKEEASLRETVHEYGRYKEVLEGIKETEEMIFEGDLDAEMDELAKAELSELTAEREQIRREVEDALVA